MWLANDAKRFNIYALLSRTLKNSPGSELALFQGLEVSGEAHVAEQLLATILPSAPAEA